jgi:hypothetical protein
MCCNPAPFRLLPLSFVSPLSRHLVVLLRGPLLARLISIHWRVQRPRLFYHVITIIEMNNSTHSCIKKRTHQK